MRPISLTAIVPALILVPLTTAPAPAQDCEWELASSTGPSARWLIDGAMAFDSRRGVSVLFGGDSNGFFGDTWEWDGSNWSLKSTTGPTPRNRHALAYDSNRGVVVLFGGWDQINTSRSVGDTWEWDGSNWTLRTTTGPRPRHFHAMAFDERLGVTIVHGGQTWDGQWIRMDDVWTWDGSTWNQVSTSSTGPRVNHGMVYDSTRQVAVVFGGFDGVNRLGDTWEWAGGPSSWDRVATTGPSPRNALDMAFDSARGRTILFGGSRDGSGAFGDTWEWDGSQWTELIISGPGTRMTHAMTFDSRRNVVVTFGGRDHGQTHMWTTWEMGCDVPGFRLGLTGSCPGSMTAQASGASPGGNVGFVFGAGPGQTTIPSGPCRGTVLPVQGNVQLVATTRANANGVATITGNAPRAACGGLLVAVDVATCEVSNAVRIE